MTKDTKIRFIFAGRLVKEKGFDLLLALFEKIEQDKILRDSFHIDIFGDGELKEIVEKSLAKRNFVTYHGHQPKEKVMKTRKKCQYTLMPSRFLETFGLSALDSLSLGVPVIAPDKGGLAQFIEKTSDLRLQTSETLYVLVKRIVDTFDKDVWAKQSQVAKNTYQSYTMTAWLERFQELSGLEPGAKIMLISDYIVDVGGIEHYLINVKKVLEEAGYVVRLVGCADESKARNRFRQLFRTLWNTEAKQVVEESVADFKPDILWRHSVQRWLGPAPLRSQCKFSGKQWVMYHDFGLFHPYPSCVEEEKQVEQAAHVMGYLWQGWKSNKLAFLLYLAKWYSSAILKGLLANHIDLHIVPSPYMEKLIQKQYDKEISLVTLSHFAP